VADLPIAPRPVDDEPHRHRRQRKANILGQRDIAASPSARAWRLDRVGLAVR
jgi:hypothetical protein